MGMLTVVIVAFGLAADAFAVSVASGAAYRQLHIKQALRMALFFGAFQAVMPVVGWLAGLSVRKHIEQYDHWVAFVLLAAIGIKMIYESFKIRPQNNDRNPMDLGGLLALSIATSIDALAVGITISLLDVSIVTAVIIIGMVTFVLSWTGVAMGKRFGHLFENRIEAAAGIILIAIGVKIVVSSYIS
ncbi:MAG: manganese efflux pump MntP family protein [Planctomycetota bacterium]